MSRRNRLIRALLAIAALVIVISLIVWSIPFQRHLRFIEKRLSQAIGLELRIRGELHLGLLPTPRFEATDVAVANLPGRPSPHLLEIGRLALSLNDWRFLSGTIEIDGLEIEDAELRIETDAEGRFGLRHHLESLASDPEPGSSGAPVAFRVRRLDFEELRVFHHRGDEAAVRSLRLEVLTLEADQLDASIAVEARGELDGSPIAVSGSIGPLSELLAPSRPYPFSLQGRVFEAELELEGTVKEPRAMRGVDASISALLTDLDAVSGERRRELSRLGPIRVTGRVRRSDDVISVEELVVATEDDRPLRAEARGSVADLRAFRGVALELRVEADDLEFLEPFVDRPLPEIDSLSARASLADRDGSLGIEGRLRAIAPDERLTLELAGGHDDLSRIDEVDLHFELSARDLRVIGEALALEQELPDLGPISVSGRLRDHTGALGVEAFTARLGRPDDTWVEIDGSIEDLLGLRGVRLSGRFGAANLHDAAPFLTDQMPDIGPIRGSANLSDADGSLGLEGLRLGGGREGFFEIALTGGLDDLRDLDEIALEGKLEARDLAIIGQIFGAELPPIGPVEFSGRVTGSNERIVAGGARLRLDKTRLEGDLSGSFVPGTRPTLRARIRSPHIHLDDIGIEPRSGDAATSAPAEATEAPRSASVADEPLPFERLRALDLELDLQASRVTGHAGLDVTDFAAFIHLDDGRLSIRQADGEFEAGRVHLELQVDARTPVPLLELRGQASGIDLNRLAAQLRDDAETAGILDASLDLRTRGSTPAELRGHLEGNFRAIARDGTMTNRYAHRMVRDLMRVSIPSFRMPRKAPEVSCLVAEFSIEDGIATTETLFLDAPLGIITAVGELDLGRNQLDLRVTPRPVDPGLLSVAVTVDVTGPIGAPVLTPVHRTLATSAVQGLLSNAMRPARAVLSPFSRETPDQKDLCPSGGTERSID